VLAGTAYALAIYGLMYWAVMPARFGINPSVEPWPLGNALFSHIACVGLPMAYITHRVFGSRSAFAPIQNALPGASATLLISAAACLNFGSPARAVDRSENAIFAGGCFWGVEGVFEHVKGVRSVVSGYAGGRRSNFRGAGGERTDFAEAVRVNFDPEAISYHQLLEIFAAVAHDPTQVNRQGPDVGTRYRSAIFPQNARQRETAQKFLINARASGRYGRPIATRIEGGGFAVAERAHQDYMRKHPKAPYVVINDLPKLVELRRRFPQLWRD
jgi:peptide-methionine (S)-S-oxide reductase